MKNCRLGRLILEDSRKVLATVIMASESSAVDLFQLEDVNSPFNIFFGLFLLKMAVDCGDCLFVLDAGGSGGLALPIFEDTEFACADDAARCLGLQLTALFASFGHLESFVEQSEDSVSLCVEIASVDAHQVGNLSCNYAQIATSEGVAHLGQVVDQLDGDPISHVLEFEWNVLLV